MKKTSITLKLALALLVAPTFSSAMEEHVVIEINPSSSTAITVGNTVTQKGLREYLTDEFMDTMSKKTVVDGYNMNDLSDNFHNFKVDQLGTSETEKKGNKMLRDGVLKFVKHQIFGLEKPEYVMDQVNDGMLYLLAGSEAIDLESAAGVERIISEGLKRIADLNMIKNIDKLEEFMKANRQDYYGN